MTISELSQPTLFDETELPLTPSAADFHAKTFLTLEKALELRVNEAVYGENIPASLASYDHQSSSWRTSQRCLVEGWTRFSETWPRSGMTRGGTAYQLQPLAPITRGIGCGLLPTITASEGGYNKSSPNGKVRPTLTTMARHVSWPAPRANDAEKRGSIASDPRNGLPAAVLWPTARSSSEMSESIEGIQARGGYSSRLEEAVAMYPTPTVQDAANNGPPSQHRRNSKPLNAVVNGALNPDWVEGLMGFPLGWTDRGKPE